MVPWASSGSITAKIAKDMAFGWTLCPWIVRPCRCFFGQITIRSLSIPWKLAFWFHTVHLSISTTLSSLFVHIPWCSWKWPSLWIEQCRCGMFPSLQDLHLNANLFPKIQSQWYSLNDLILCKLSWAQCQLINISGDNTRGGKLEFCFSVVECNCIWRYRG